MTGTGGEEGGKCPISSIKATVLQEIVLQYSGLIPLCPRRKQFTLPLCSVVLLRLAYDRHALATDVMIYTWRNIALVLRSLCQFGLTTAPQCSAG